MHPAFATPEAHWRALALAGAWQELLAATQAPQPASSVIPAALWQARALRVLNQGEAANQALLAASQGPYEASALQLAELAEELVQCAYYDAALRLAAPLQAKQAPQADYLYAMLWREREDWAQCHAALTRLKARGQPGVIWHNSRKPGRCCAKAGWARPLNCWPPLPSTPIPVCKNCWPA